MLLLHHEMTDSTVLSTVLICRLLHFHEDWDGVVIVFNFCVFLTLLLQESPRTNKAFQL